MGKKHCGKRRKCWLSEFSPFPTMFSKGFFFRVFKRSLLKTLWNKKKIVVTSISPFPTMFSPLSKTNFKFSITFILSSANAFNFDQSKFFSFGKELILSLTPDLETYKIFLINWLGSNYFQIWKTGEYA